MQANKSFHEFKIHYNWAISVEFEGEKIIIKDKSNVSLFIIEKIPEKHSWYNLYDLILEINYENLISIKKVIERIKKTATFQSTLVD